MPQDLSTKLPSKSWTRHLWCLNFFLAIKIKILNHRKADFWNSREEYIDENGIGVHLSKGSIPRTRLGETIFFLLPLSKSLMARQGEWSFSLFFFIWIYWQPKATCMLSGVIPLVQGSFLIDRILNGKIWLKLLANTSFSWTSK